MFSKNKQGSKVEQAAESYTFNPPTVAAASATPAPPVPEFIRLPKHGQRCAYTGLSRPYLYSLVRQGLVKGTILRRKGAFRGVVLVHLASLRAYLAAAMEAPLPEVRARHA
jgi:hypothetical protein